MLSTLLKLTTVAVEASPLLFVWNICTQAESNWLLLIEGCMSLYVIQIICNVKYKKYLLNLNCFM